MPIASLEEVIANIREYMNALATEEVYLTQLEALVNGYFSTKNIVLLPDTWNKAVDEALIRHRYNREHVSLKPLCDPSTKER